MHRIVSVVLAGVMSVLLSVTMVVASPFGAAGTARSIAVTTETGPAGDPATSAWGWVVVRDGFASDYAPPDLDQGNSTGGENWVVFNPIVSYTITMPGLGAYGDGGSVLVTTMRYFGRVRFCNPDRWGPSAADPNDLEIIVRCWDREGSNGGHFVVNFVKAIPGGEETPHRFAYTYEHLPLGGTEYRADWQYASRGGVIEGARDGFTHREFIPDLGSRRGHVQITASARREGYPFASPAVCSVLGWHDMGPTGVATAGDLTDMVVESRCRSFQGELVTDRMYEMLFTQGDDIQGLGGRVGAYLLADQPKVTSYAPQDRYTFLQNSGTANIRRRGVGEYTVTLPILQAGGSVQLTVYGGGERRCILEGMSSGAAKPKTIKVDCFDFTRTPKDAMFLLSYAW